MPTVCQTLVDRFRLAEFTLLAIRPAAAKGALTMPGTIMLSELLEHLMSTLDISHSELAQAVGSSDRTVLRWLADETYPQHESRDKLDDLKALVQRLDTSFTTPDGAAVWLHAPSGYFGGLRPVDALVRGRVDAVHSALDALDAGIFV
jgi:hypothetical protein